MRRLLNTALMVAGVAVPACLGQSLLDELNFRGAPLAGLHLIGVSVYSGYATTPAPLAGYALNGATQGLNALGPDENYGVTASIGWQRHVASTDISVLYSGSYQGLAHYSTLNGFSQTLWISAARKLTPRWRLNLSGSGSDATIAQYLFQPSSLSVISTVPSSFDDLAAALAVGKYSSTEAAALLTSSPILQSAGRSVLMGNRVLSYSVQAGLDYSISSRLQLHLSSFGAAGETRLSGQDGIGAASYIMPRTLGATAGLGFTYSLSPQTDLGGNLSETDTVNHFQTIYTTTAGVSVGRRIGQRWIVRANGGGAYGLIKYQTIGNPTSRQLIGGGSLGFRAGRHTLVGSYQRSASDTFGFAVGTNTSIAGAWSWHPPGSRLTFSASMSDQQTRNTGFVSLSGWQASAGAYTNLSPRSTLSAQYVYLHSDGTFQGAFNIVTVQSVQVTLGWAPQGAQRQTN